LDSAKGDKETIELLLKLIDVGEMESKLNSTTVKVELRGRNQLSILSYTHAKYSQNIAHQSLTLELFAQTQFYEIDAALSHLAYINSCYIHNNIVEKLNLTRIEKLFLCEI